MNTNKLKLITELLFVVLLAYSVQADDHRQETRAVTLWWLFFNNPDARLGVIYATGGITDPRGKIRLVASAYRSANDVVLSLGPNVVDPPGLGRASRQPGHCCMGGVLN